MSPTRSGDLRPPIILFGNFRSGNTIVQDLVATHPDVVGWYEPNSLWLYADPGRSHDEFDESDATEKVQRYIRGRFLQYQRDHDDQIVLEKSPHNILRIPYVRAIFPEATYLYMVRDPFSFISSVELKWQRPVTTKGAARRLRETPITQLHHYAAKYGRQQFAKRVQRSTYLPAWGPRYRDLQDDLAAGEDMLTVIARQWARASAKAEQDLAAFGDGEVLRLRYEDFVDDPVTDLERICAHCGLTMTTEMADAARERVSPNRTTKWRRLDPQELHRVVPELREEMDRHGYEVPAELLASIDNGHLERP